MTNTILKIVLVAWFLFTGYWLLPLKKPKQYKPDSEANTIVATQQFCETPCADIVIKKGMLIIPDSIASKYSELRRSVAHITGNSPFKKSKGALMFSYDFIMSGYVVGVDSTATDGNVPVYYIKEWYPTQYIARFWKLTGKWEVLYLINLNLGLPLFLFFSFKSGKRVGF
jgi:hypothetical protein